jgi:hypothetical protein
MAIYIYISENFKNDEELLLAALKTDNCAFICASDKLRNNKNIILKVIEKDNSLFKYVSNELQNDKEIILTAVENNYTVLKNLSNKLKEDKEFLIKCYKKNNYTFMTNEFIGQFAIHEQGHYDYNFIENNINILHLLENKEGLCNYLIKEKQYHIIFQNNQLTEYFKNNTKFDNFFWNKNMIVSILNTVVLKKEYDCL